MGRMEKENGGRRTENGVLLVGRHKVRMSIGMVAAGSGDS